MKISIITLFPKMISSFFEASIIKRAIDKKLVEIEIINLRDFAIDDYGTVDDRPYGGGAGMIMRIEPIYKAVQSVIFNFKFLISKQVSNIQKPISKIILTSPRGKLFSQTKAAEYSNLNHLIIIAGHYEGVDERVLNFVDEEISLGDFILTGGEIVAATIVDATVRLIPGVLTKKEATEKESFFEVEVEKLEKIITDNYLKKLKRKGVKKVKLLEYPQYTRPAEFKELKVPEVLLKGNHKKIEEWRMKKAYQLTKEKRKDLLPV